MIKQNKYKIIISSIITLLPMIFGFLVWNRLPENIATSFGWNGEVTGYNSKIFAVVGLPAILAFVNLICIIATSADPRRKNIGSKIFSVVISIVPVCSLLCGACIYGNALGYKSTGNDDAEDTVLCSIIGNKLLPAELFESYGTIRFINEFPLVIRVLLNGGTLVMDEFDASIHPMALMNIINVFHNDDINKNHAQLIFNTHNPIFLDSSLLRRDEIKFVEREDETGNSIHYALSDFKTADGIRKGEDYMNNYFVSRYGAIKDVDFSPMLEKVIVGNEVPGDE